MSAYADATNLLMVDGGLQLLSNLANLLLGVWLWKCSLYSCLHAASSGQSHRLYVAATDVLNQDNI